MNEKDNWNFIFTGIGRDFEKFWKLKINQKEHTEEEYVDMKIKKWNMISSWIDDYSTKIYSIIPNPHTTCMIETKQEYAEFTKEDIVGLIDNIGKLSQIMYSANLHVFGGWENIDILKKYYVFALEQVTWLTATFVNVDKKDCDFISLKERLETHLL